MKQFMKLFLCTVAATAAIGAYAQEESAPKIKFYGFVRNYMSFDTRESVAGTEDLFYYLPKDRKLSGGEDLNQVNSFRFASLTSRLGVDVTYSYGGWDMGAKIETDFYNGLSGSTGTANLRLRQAYMTLAKDGLSIKFGQAWHPLAADLPDVLSLNSGAPFNPFSRTPLLNVDYRLGDRLTLNVYAIWQMQYTSAGPVEGAESGVSYSADFIKYGCTPEFFLGLSYSDGGGLVRIGADLLSIKPRRYDSSLTKKVSDRITTVSPFVYAQYVDGDFSIKAKTVFAQAGEHLNLNGGYGVTSFNRDDSWSYTPTRNSSSWVSVMYGKKLQGIFFAGYVKNFGTAEDIVDTGHLYFSKNSFSNMNQMYRITPTVAYNFGKLSLGLEYELTGVQYGEWGVGDKRALATRDLHWVTNHRVQFITKFSF